MTSRSTSRSKKVLALAFSFGLVAAACGSDDDGDSEEPPATEAEAEAEEEAPAEEAEEEAPEEEAPAEDDATEEEAPEEEAPAEDDATDDEAMEEEAMEEPTGEPFVIGVQNLEGDPAGSFPEFALAIEAAAEYVNSELGGLQGRPIELEICKSVVTPDDSQRCANELSAAGVDMAISTINFFGNHFSIYEGSDIPVLVVTPITIADFTTPGVYSIGAGGGCLGVHTGLVEWTTNGLQDELGIEVNSVGVPWADTPPGVVCYNDLEAKPLDVIAGNEPGTSARAGENPDLTYLGVPIAPATPDPTPQATEILGFEPDAIIFSAQGADCWNFVDALGRLGWTPDQIPLTLSGACTDFEAQRAAGELAEGVFFTGSGNTLLNPLDGQEPGKNLDDATTYQTKGLEYGMDEETLFKGFATQGFSAIMNIWDVAQTVDEVSGQSIEDAFASTDGTVPTFGGAPLNCSGAPEPYVAVCASEVSINVWDGDQFQPVLPSLSGLDLVAGTELRPGG